MLASTLSRAGVTAAAILLFALTGSAPAAQPAQRKAADAAPPWVNSGLQSGATAALTGRSGFARQHGGAADHLPAVRENIDLVGRLKLDTPAQYRTPEHNKPIEEGQIADVAVYKRLPRLLARARGAGRPGERGGFFSSTSRTPPTRSSWRSCRRCRRPTTARAPTRRAQHPGLQGRRAGGQQRAVRRRTASAASTSTTSATRRTHGCSSRAPATSRRRPGGPPASLTHPGPAEVPTARTRSSSGRTAASAYAVIVDNTSSTTSTSSTSPTRRPGVHRRRRPVRAGRRAGHRPRSTRRPTATRLPPRHGRQEDRRRADDARLLLGRGLHQARRHRPGEPAIIGDTDFGDDGPAWSPARGSTPEGNAHQAEFSHDNRFLLAADEDFSAFRAGKFTITRGPNAGEPVQGPGGAGSAGPARQRVNGPTAYVGYACPGPRPCRRPLLPPPLATGEEAISAVPREPEEDPANPDHGVLPRREGPQRGPRPGLGRHLIIANRH